ncbi:RNase A-like domain-containing protein, partial [Chryseobacterium sp. P1-3]
IAIANNISAENQTQALGLAALAVILTKGKAAPGIIKTEGWLAYHEGSTLGHTLARHVGKTDADLISRLATQKGITGASSFTNEAIAESVISSTIKSNRDAIKSWLRSGMTNSLRLEYSGSTNIGRGIMRTTNVVNDLTNARVILKSNGSGGYFILTAFPR